MSSEGKKTASINEQRLLVEQSVTEVRNVASHVLAEPSGRRGGGVCDPSQTRLKQEKSFSPG